jgi:hypothetical protein
MNYLYFNNFYYKYDEIKIDEQEIIDFNISKIDYKKYNIVMYNKYSKKYILFYLNFYHMQYDFFEKNDDYSIYLIFAEKNMINIDYNNKKLIYNHIFLNDYNSYNYVSKYKINKPSNDILIIYYGSMKNFQNFSIFSERFYKISNIIFQNNNIKNMYCINNDLHHNIYFNRECDISFIVDDLDENNFIYISYLVSMFYKNIHDINFSKIILVSINHSILGLSSLTNLKMLPDCNYYADSLQFCIFNEKDFIKVATLFPNYLYLEKCNFLQYIKSNSNIKMKKIEDISVLKIN